jgi:hypothetical protein
MHGRISAGELKEQSAERFQPPRFHGRISHFAFHFCDTQSTAFSTVPTITESSKPALDFVIQVFCEISLCPKDAEFANMLCLYGGTFRRRVRHELCLSVLLSVGGASKESEWPQFLSELPKPLLVA